MSGNKEFHVINQPAVKVVEDYASGSSPALVYKLEIQRLASNHAYIVVLPVLTSLLMLVVFWMPPHSPCRFGLCKCSWYSSCTSRITTSYGNMLRHCPINCSWVVTSGQPAMKAASAGTSPPTTLTGSLPSTTDSPLMRQHIRLFTPYPP